MQYQIVIDDNPINPRDYENLGTIICTNSAYHKYGLGDNYSNNIEEIEAILNSPDNIALPLYAYIHSGIILSTNEFNCPWDSGQIGCIFTSKENIKKNFNIKRLTNKMVEKTKEYLKEEISIYNHYLSGEVYGYIINNSDGTEINSCYGYYDAKLAETAAKEELAYLMQVTKAG